MARHSADTRRVVKSMNVVQWLCALLLNLIVLLLCEVSEAKVFERCELAKVLRHKHALSLPEVAKWVCIAQHSSGFNTETHASGPDGSSHGLFQISDVYWCSPPGKGSGCNLPCARLRDADLTDDLQCTRRIVDEHQKISGDGYTAWNAYSQFCRFGAQSYIEGCFPRSDMEKTFKPAGTPNFLQVAAAFKRQASNTFSSQSTYLSNFIPTSDHYDGLAKKRSKIYERCELAQELYYKHKMPMEEIPTWVCIAEHESRFDTSAVGRRNADGSADHGIFQISDLFWCSKDPYGSKACGLQCNKLLDEDITDDVRCIRRIYGEHTAITGDGFTAWTVYNQHCRNQEYQQVATCFPQHQSITGTASTQLNSVVGSTISAHNQFSYLANKPHTGKVYKRCELAQELYFIHKFPIQDIATWLCIVQHESNYNTAAVGRLNGDGSADHGLFQISDLYWCSHESSSGGKACNIPCEKLLDSDITDDVRCVKTIYEEHTRISGDGFTAWTVYNGNCRSQRIEQISTCFDSAEIEKGKKAQADEKSSSSSTSGAGKIYKQCELAQELYFKHKMPMDEIPTWVCIAQHESSFNTAAVGRLNTDGSADHGLFQISDLYWCSHDSYGGKACNIPCNKLLDSDITDDVRCIRTIHEEHTRISGDGFTAWTVYNPHCRQQRMDRIANCFNSTTLAKASVIQKTTYKPSVEVAPSGPRKIYKKCELAQELYFKHNMPMEEIPTWVCIAQHESSFNTAAVGRLNTDGSADHGLFQISDLYWCTHDSYGGKACNIACNKLLDSDITDDVRCVQTIYEEHTRISGDGFNAWTVYKPHCRQQRLERIADCFNSTTLAKASAIQKTTYKPSAEIAPSGPRKIYKKCELAQELYFKHKMPMEEIPTWVCIAQHESSFNTAAVGRLNTDGSADHGLFQISDLYWCTHDSYGGKACNIPCNKLLDSDITDDVRCVQTIYEEHTRISGDGFNAWTVYKPHCRQQRVERIADCFNSTTLAKASAIQKTTHRPSVEVAPSEPRKVYKKCELAQELYFKHKMPMEEIPTWVCIAQHESSFNTAAVGRLNTDGSADHGLFQISDLYWCTHDSYGGKACNIPCNKLLDSDITDDVRCVQTIYEEHTRISGDGFNAWTVYKPHCRQQRLERIADCFNSTTLAKASAIQKTTYKPSAEIAPSGPRKIYKKCELAQELYFKHKMPMEEIPTWVCIAQHESSFNTAAVGRLNTDGSADHGLFQISDLYWCTHDSYGGKACNIPCNKLLDSDITDDVRCVQTIYEEHTRISGDGFNAWTVYKPHCRQQRVERIADCFNSTTLAKASAIQKTTYRPSVEVAPSGPRKVYKKCELAQELYFKHKMPMEEIPTWVCIAQHESSFNTAAVGRLNTDGSADHGLFQISDLYWCTHDSYGGKACNIPCYKLLDSDITDDVRCVRTIYEEHTRISGDGFTAWTVYGPHCRNQQLEQIKSCFDSKILSMAGQSQETGAPVILTLPHMLGASNEYTKMIRGLKPDAKIHQTFVDVQHLTGTPLQGGKRVQFNMFLKSINRITITENLTTVLMPSIWVEEGIQLNSEMVAFFKKKLINTLKTLNIIHWTALCGGITVAILSLIYYLVQRYKPEVEAPLK